MSPECALRSISALQLPKRPLVDDFVIASILEHAGGDPGLRTREKSQKMATQGAYRCHTSSRSQPPRLTPRTFALPYGKLGLNARAAEKQVRMRRVAAEASMCLECETKSWTSGRTKNDMGWMPFILPSYTTCARPDETNRNGPNARDPKLSNGKFSKSRPRGTVCSLLRFDYRTNIMSTWFALVRVGPRCFDLR
jgi:hypothetical protein